MIRNQRRLTRAQRRRREQRRMQTGAIALTALCAVALVAMAIVNRMPLSDSYTYTSESDLWIVDGGDVAIAAPELPPAEATPTAVPEPVATEAPGAEATPSPTPSAEPA